MPPQVASLSTRGTRRCGKCPSAGVGCDVESCLQWLHDGDSRTIEINDKATDTQFETTLLYETIPAVLHSTGWTEKLGDDEEALVRALEHGLMPLVNLKS